MQAIITEFHDKTTCTWCERETEGVTVEFEQGFLEKSALCWRCLQQATRVHHKQTRPPETTASPTPRTK